MAEYIEREAALALVRPDAPEDEKAAVTIATAKKLVRSIVRRTPAADVPPVRHGRWIYHPDDLFPGDSTQECSCCHEEEYLTLYNENYCPNCGAKMDGGAD